MVPYYVFFFSPDRYARGAIGWGKQGGMSLALVFSTEQSTAQTTIKSESMFHFECPRSPVSLERTLLGGQSRFHLFFICFSLPSTVVSE